MSGGGGVSTSTPYEVDKGQLASFLGSAMGQQYASSYDPKMNYAQIGDSIQVYDPANFTDGKVGSMTTVGQDVTPMIKAYEAWAAGNNQTKANWESYSAAANANEGGQGDTTITSGVAVGQRQALLGALANAGNPTTPTPGLGSMGTLMENGVPKK